MRSVVSIARRWFRPNLDAAELLRKEERRLIRLCVGLPIEARAKVQGGLALALVGEPVRVETPKGSLAFAVFGQPSAQRAKGLLTKQPATIESPIAMGWGGLTGFQRSLSPARA